MSIALLGISDAEINTGTSEINTHDSWSIGGVYAWDELGLHDGIPRVICMFKSLMFIQPCCTCFGVDNDWYQTSVFKKESGLRISLL